MPASYLATLTRYTFDLNGVKYAEFMRAQMEEALRRKGELPNKVNLGPIRAYVDMTGSGEIWVNAESLPVRQVIHMQFPPEKGATEWVEAEIVTNFSDWQLTPAAAISQLWNDPARIDQRPAGNRRHHASPSARVQLDAQLHLVDDRWRWLVDPLSSLSPLVCRVGSVDHRFDACHPADGCSTTLRL